MENQGDKDKKLIVVLMKYESPRMDLGCEHTDTVSGGC